VHAQLTPRSLTARASTACFLAFPINVAHAGARVGMHQHGEKEGMTSLRQSIVQPKPTTVNALPRRALRLALCSASATRGSL